MKSPSERYLDQLRRALSDLAADERDEILSDLRSLLSEHAEQGDAEEEVLARLGAAEALAGTYRTERLLSAATRSSAPGAIVRALLRWALVGVGGFFGSLLLFLGYVLSIGLVAVGLLKPIFPSNVGLWPANGLGAHWPSPGGPELLGYWIIPICLVAGGLLYVLTTRLAWRLLGAARRNLPLPGLDPR